ncbi:TauD/TfdA dioxygenase family protein [Phenylobacterium sp.]|uniref:TauD/TfdA dioxygenase family protein n=1 Tax=Phenylobacterium sp. TaxID=1871053 RepID=UPI002F3E9E70
MNQLARNLTVLGLEIAPLTPTVGAEVHGLDLAEPQDDATLSALRAALLDWKVLFFRDQDITTEQHLAFAGHFSELEVHPSPLEPL